VLQSYTEALPNQLCMQSKHGQQKMKRLRKAVDDPFNWQGDHSKYSTSKMK